ncbi:MAG: hypothetical protein V1933_06295 [Candidatus Omnitrophota bacterium]
MKSMVSALRLGAKIFGKKCEYAAQNYSGLICIFVLVLLCILVYSNIFHDGFLIDDHILFEDSPKLLQDTTTAELFREGYNFTYRPIGLMFLKFEYFAFGKNAIGYHVMNILIFAGICVVMFGVLYKVTKDRAISFLSTALYAVHPINNFLLNYKTATNLSLFILCAFAATWFFIGLARTGKPLYLIVSLIFYFAALLCHEIGFMTPAYLFLIAVFFYRDNLKRCFFYTLTYTIPFAVFFILRVSSRPSVKITGLFNAKASIFQSLNTFYELSIWYLSKLFFPANMLFMWEERLKSSAFQLIPILVLSIIVICAIYFIKKGQRNIFAFGFVVFAVGFIPAFLASFTYTVNLRTALIEPHWFGYASAGFFLMAAASLWKLKKIVTKPATISFCLLLICVLGVWTYRTNRLWKDDKTYCEYWMMISSINSTPWEALARRYIAENSDKKMKNSVDLANLGLMFHLRRNAYGAIQLYQEALEMDKNCAAAYYGLGALFSDIGDSEKANEAFKIAGEIQPEYFEAYRLLAEVFVNQGEKDYGRRIKAIVDQANREGKANQAKHKLTGGWVF